MLAGGHRLGLAVWVVLAASPVAAEGSAEAVTQAEPATATPLGKTRHALSRDGAACIGGPMGLGPEGHATRPSGGVPIGVFAVQADVALRTPAPAHAACFPSSHAAVPPESALARTTPRAPESASASVLLAPVQGSDALLALHADSIAAAVGEALASRGYRVRTSPPWANELVECGTPECAEQAIDGARVAFGVVPAVWARPAEPAELTLTLIERSGRSLNARGAMSRDPLAATATLVDELLARQAVLASGSLAHGATLARLASTEPAPRGSELSEPPHPHAWKAGPAILIAAGAGSFVSVGVAAGLRGEGQRLNPAATGAWCALGAAAIGGGIAWWVVGDKRRRRSGPAISLGPTRIDLRLQF